MECKSHCFLWYPLCLLTTCPDQPSGTNRTPRPKPITFTSNVVFGGQACKPGPWVPSREPRRAPLVFQSPRLMPSSVYDPLTGKERHK